MASTIKDIARKVGVSVSTVSYALNNGPRPVKQHIKKMVLEAAKDLDYRPNSVARSLITRRSSTIGVVPTETVESITLSPYFQGCLEGIVNEAEVLGQDVLLYTRYDQSRSDQFLNSLLDGRADGVIFLAPKTHSTVLHSLGGRLPAVVVSSHRVANTHPLRIDNAGGVRKAIRHLKDLGHTRIGHLHGRLELEDAVERLDAFKAAIQDAGLEFREEWIVGGDFTPRGGREAGLKFISLKDRPTAIFCGNDESAIGFMRAALESGLELPRDLSIVGFDDSQAAQLTFPALTTIRQPLAKIGSAALIDLLSMIEGDIPNTRGSFETELIVRDSTSRPKEDS